MAMQTVTDGMTLQPAPSVPASVSTPSAPVRRYRAPDRPARGSGGVIETMLADVLPRLHARHGLDASDLECGATDAREAPGPMPSRSDALQITPITARVAANANARSDMRNDALDGLRPLLIPSAPASTPVEDAAFDAALCAADRVAWDETLARLSEAMATGALTRTGLRTGVVAPAARRLGTAWSDDDASFVDVTIGTARLSEALDSLPGRVRDGAGARVVLAPIPGDGHVLGLLLLAETLREGGFAVEVMARPSAAAVGRAVGGRADVLGIGVPVGRHAGRAAMLVRAVRAASRNAPMPLVVAGGAAAADSAALLHASGVDEVMTGPHDPAAWLDARLRERAATHAPS